MNSDSGFTGSIEFGDSTTVLIESRINKLESVIVRSPSMIQ